MRIFVILMKILAKYILLVAACLLMWQCKPEPQPQPDPQEPTDPDPAISFIGPSRIELSGEDNSGSVVFISAAEWTAASDASWIQFSPESGSGSGDMVTLAVTGDPNPTEEERSATITITSGSLSKTVPITQPGKEPEGPKSTECELSSIMFLAASNASLQDNLTIIPRYIRGMKILFITFPEGADINNMVVFCNMSKKATVRIGERQIANGQTPVDFSKNEPLTIVAEDGEHSDTFTVISRIGDPVLDNKIYNFMGAYNIPAVGLGITKNEQLAYVAGYGVAEIGADPVLCTPEHLFRLASMSKSLTSICILRLCQEGKLSPDTKVFAPGGPLAEMFPGTHAAKVDDIRIRDLLSHRSGWTNYGIGDDPIFPYTSRFYSLHNLKERVATIVKNNSPSNTPGMYYSYSNLGFSILGLVIEQVTGKSYETYLREVMAMAGANDIWVSKTARSGKRANECVFYSQDSGYPYDNNMEIAAACGGVIASPADLARVLTAIDYGKVVPDILGTGWLDAMYTNYTSSGKGGYGFGWWIGHNTMTTWQAYHTGTLSGTKTLWVKGNNGVNGVILCNSNSGKSGFDTAMFVALDDAMTQVKQAH